MSLDYSWKLFQKCWAFSFSTLYLDRVFHCLQGTQIRFGFWVIVSRESVISHQAASTHNDHDRYEHEALERNDCIRLFKLEPGREGDPLRGSLTSYVLSRSLEYEALSYVWGDPVSDAVVSIKDHIMPVTRNLESALRNLRQENESRLLWIDAMCIDQTNVREKSIQVPMMGSIYRCAKNVVIWLGPTGAYSEIGMKTLKWFLAPIQSHYSPPWMSESPTLIAAGLQDILGRPWFGRMWVAQEAGMSQRATITCGRFKFSWTNDVSVITTFAKMIKFAAITPCWLQTSLRDVDMDSLLQLLDFQMGEHWDKTWGGSNRPAKDLIDHAYATRDKLCTDPRDKLFALIGFVEGTSLLDSFHANYTMSVEESYQNLWESMLQSHTFWGYPSDFQRKDS